jgi:DNA-binding LacI/PurR family transcriptional regulator
VSVVKTHLIKQEMVQHELLQWAQHARAGARLQPERDLALDMGVSRTTIRLAVDELVRIGVLKRIHGSGVYVNHADVATKYKVALVYFDDFGPMQNSLQLPVMQKAETAMINAGFEVVLIPVHIEEATHPNLHGVDAVLTLSRIDTSSLQDIIPIVSLFDPLCPYDNVICLLSDDYLLGKMATKYLVDLGHRRIAFVADTDDTWARERYRGICDTANELSIPSQSSSRLSRMSQSDSMSPNKLLTSRFRR